MNSKPAGYPDLLLDFLQVWELAARRVAALLSVDAICTATPHHFLQSLEWTNKFILAGEAFSGTEAHGLRARVSKQSEKYFKTFHRQNLEVRMKQKLSSLWPTAEVLLR
jgi:hypothetical protein